MKNLLYKEFKLSIAAGFFLLPLLGALVIIPSWVYYVALMYCMFVTVPNIFTTNKAHNDIGFSVMLPVKKSDIVKARMASIIVMELLHILVAAIFAVLNIMWYKGNNFFSEPNVAFFGLAFVMFGIFNLILFPGFYKTAYKVAMPVMLAMSTAIVFMVIVECLVIFVPAVSIYIDGVTNMIAQIPVLLIGILLFALSTVVSFRVSAKRFDRIDL